jgi:predicted nucleotidyltransferase
MEKYIGADLSTLVFDEAVAAEARVKLTPKTAAIKKEEAIYLCGKFANIVRKQVDSNALIFVFGSIIKGTADKRSDIDTAIVSRKLDKDFFGVAAKLSGLAHDVSWDIEVHAIAYEDWLKGNPHVLEVKEWGVEI